MTTISYQPIDYIEHYVQHAERLQVSPTWVQRRRAVLAAKLAGKDLPQSTSRRLCSATLECLLQTLAVQRVSADDGYAPIWLVPVAIVPTDDLQRGRMLLQQVAWDCISQPAFIDCLVEVSRNGAHEEVIPNLPVVPWAVKTLVSLGQSGLRMPWEHPTEPANDAGDGSSVNDDLVKWGLNMLCRPEYAGMRPGQTPEEWLRTLTSRRHGDAACASAHPTDNKAVAEVGAEDWAEDLDPMLEHPSDHLGE